MHVTKRFQILPACLLAVFLMAAGAESALAQSKLQDNPGGYQLVICGGWVFCPS